MNIFDEFVDLRSRVWDLAGEIVAKGPTEVNGEYIYTIDFGDGNPCTLIFRTPLEYPNRSPQEFWAGMIRTAMGVRFQESNPGHWAL